MPVTIHSRLLTLVLSLLLPGLLGVAWLVGQTFEAERAAHERTLRETARALSMVVDREFSARSAIARTLSASRWLDDAPAMSHEQIEAFAGVARAAMQGLEGWVELRAPGRVLLDTREPAAGAVRTSRNAAAAPAGTLVTEPEVRPLQDSGGGGHAAIVQPVQRQGRTVLNLIVALRPRELQTIIDVQGLSSDWISSVMDSRGVVVARHPGGSAYVGRKAPDELLALIGSRREGLFEFTSLEGQPLTAYFSTSPQGWTYQAAMPRRQFTGQLSQAVLRLVAGALLLLAVAIGGAYWVSRGIVAPVRSLKDIARRMQAGDAVERRSTGVVEFDAVATALADAAEALESHRRDLERQVDEAVQRTRQAEQRASQGQRIEALGRLTGGVAHDFNNLLGVISNSAHLIQRQAKAPELEVPVAATLRAVEVGRRLTQHLLRFAGRRPVRPQWLQLGVHLPDMVDLLRSVLGRHIEISVDVAGDTLPVRVDASELELALINLALNARDAMPSGGELQVRARNAEASESEGLPGAPGRPYVLITLSDNGLGLDADLAERVFEPFFTTKATGQGTGLGLSQVHGFCAQAGGTARLASTPGLGTTVSLLLPAWEQAGDDLADDGADAESPAFDLSGRRILLVDDNEELGRVTAALLSSHGAQTEHAGDAETALRLLQDQPAFDVVLSDIVMPGGMDGIALARRLRTERPRLPVVLISGYNTDDAATEFTTLHKPTSPSELLATLQSAMAAAPAR